jgi:ribosome maturation factor RimP
VSRELASSLDADPALASGYRLEVSSPGLDRVLGREKDFAAACGGEVRIETRAPVGGRRRFRGALLSFAEGVARVRVDGTVHELPFEAVARAQQVYHYTSADFGGKGAVPAASGEA